SRRGQGEPLGDDPLRGRVNGQSWQQAPKERNKSQALSGQRTHAKHTTAKWVSTHYTVGITG
ncbi:MAG: hypothetical protein P4L61_03425, partial [Candidatus Pacebacteria bacterium]|nr:hypothetical protein [Candidatus Paceibacterota bacterium]